MYLPIDLIGRVDIIKIHLLPKFLYILTQAPCIIPQKYFKEIDSTCSSFIWQGRAPSPALHTLQLPTTKQEIAYPNLYQYYLAAQLIPLPDWLNLQLGNSSTIMAAAIASSHKSLRNIVYRGETGGIEEQP